MSPRLTPGSVNNSKDRTADAMFRTLFVPLTQRLINGKNSLTSRFQTKQATKRPRNRALDGPYGFSDGARRASFSGGVRRSLGGWPEPASHCSVTGSSVFVLRWICVRTRLGVVLP